MNYAEETNAKMVVDMPGQLNLKESPPIGRSRGFYCFNMQELIGKGTYGEVYRAKDIITGEIVALKKILRDGKTQELPETAIMEIQILKRLRHDNIIRLREVVTSSGEEDEENQERPDKNKDKGGVYMVLDYMDHELYGLVQRHRLNFSVPQIKQLLTGLHYCHDNQVLHHDIKDFGLARLISTAFTQKHTRRYSDCEF